ncbi:protein TolB [Alphaproteobacteria bacterium]|nr:protein TolB [Alphaproteobacteria bacterium]GHS96540.1 protein TolB [Alphaproteobacteria bacterium]
MRVHITQGRVKPDPIAFVALYCASKDEAKSAVPFVDIIQHDLCSSGLFTATPPSSFLQNPESLAHAEPRLADWRAVKTRFLLCGRAQTFGRMVQVSLRLYDVNQGKKILSFSVSVSKDTLRKAAHMAADQIYTRLTGDKGMFSTQLAYIEALPPKVKGRKKLTYLRQLRIMDQDGANDRALTDGGNLVMTPRFSPDGRTLAYLAYKEDNKKRPLAHVYLLDIATKRQRALLTPDHFAAIARANGGAHVDMTYSPRFSPDGKSLCFALIVDGKSAIYTMNINEGHIRRLTDHRAIDTSPAYSPDGRSIVFTSNRSGKEKVYIMSREGSNVRCVTQGDGKYSQPVFSPRGDFIAFAKQKSNQFFIGVVRPDGTEERLIIQGYMAESPSWSPNGRYIMFIWQSGRRRQQEICKIDLTGFFMQTMKTQNEARDCTWSPLID